MKHLLSSITLLLLSTLAFGSDNNSDNLTLPHTFNSGETISSSKMNNNFNHLIRFIDNLTATIQNLEGRIKSLESPYLILYFSEHGSTDCTSEGYDPIPTATECQNAVTLKTSSSYDTSQFLNGAPCGCIKRADVWVYNTNGNSCQYGKMDSYTTQEIICRR